MPRYQLCMWTSSGGLVPAWPCRVRNAGDVVMGLNAAATCHGIVPGRLCPGHPSRREEARTEPRCLLRCRREWHSGRPCVILVIPHVRPSRHGHLRGPSARAAGGDTVTLLHVTLCSFTVLEKQILAAAVKSPQCKNKSGAGDLEVYCRCHQIRRFKRYLLKCCSYFPP